MFTLNLTQGHARRGHFETVHGSFETPAFMNVATSAAIKGGVSALDLLDVQCQIMLSNTYHLHLRPGDRLIRDFGGLGSFTKWLGPTLTDSGGFQVFSLAKIRKITEEGAEFNSHIDGRCIFIGPEESMAIQSHLGSTIAMALDECIEIPPVSYSYVKRSCERTVRWNARSKKKLAELNKLSDTINPSQLLFGINQGCTFEDLRIDNMKAIVDLDMDGYAIGGLAVGESHEEMYHIISVVEEYMPKNKVRYLMGVGTPGNILECVARGIDLFDCVMPSRNGRHGHIFTNNGIINLNNARYEYDSSVLEEGCGCPVCKAGFSRAYIKHLIRSKELLGMRFAVLHNLYFFNNLMLRIRIALDNGCFDEFARENSVKLDARMP